MRRPSFQIPSSLLAYLARPATRASALMSILALALVTPATAQDGQPEPARDATREQRVFDAGSMGVVKFEADPADTESIDAIIKASYDVISGPAGGRDWNRERSLFHPDSRHMPTRPNAHGGSNVDVKDVESFIQASSGFFAGNPFYEYEIARTTQRFGDIAHVFSTYAWGKTKGGPIGGRGINSFQLLFDGERWWIVSIYWAQESENMPIPREFLPAEE